MVGPPLTILKVKGGVKKINPLDDVLSPRPIEEDEPPAENNPPQEEPKGKEQK